MLSRYGAALAEPVGVIPWAGAESSPVWDTHLEGAVCAGQRAAAEVIAGLAQQHGEIVAYSRPKLVSIHPRARTWP